MRRHGKVGMRRQDVHVVATVLSDVSIEQLPVLRVTRNTSHGGIICICEVC
jgi:hypothetical protein